MTARATTWLVAAAIASSGCASRGHRDSPLPDAPDAVGVYRGWVFDRNERVARFRLWIRVEPPDRIHAEVLPPVGGPEWLLDAGGGRVSLTRISERIAWVGDVSEDDSARLLGLPVGIAALVKALWEGASPGETVVLERDPVAAPGLPRAFGVLADGRGIRIELLALRRATAAVFTAEPPRGLDRRPIEDLQGLGLFEPSEAGGP